MKMRELVQNQVELAAVLENLVDADMTDAEIVQLVESILEEIRALEMA
jgi:hypothetical protein